MAQDDYKTWTAKKLRRALEEKGFTGISRHTKAQLVALWEGAEADVEQAAEEAIIEQQTEPKQAKVPLHETALYAEPLNPLDLMGIRDIADDYGYNLHTLRKYSFEGRLPKPDGVISRKSKPVPVWLRASIEAWIADGYAPEPRVA